MIQLIAILYFLFTNGYTGYLALKDNGDDYIIIKAHCPLLDLWNVFSFN